MLDQTYRTVVNESIDLFHPSGRVVSDLSSVEPVTEDSSAFAHNFEGCDEDLNRWDAFVIEVENWYSENELARFSDAMVASTSSAFSHDVVAPAAQGHDALLKTHFKPCFVEDMKIQMAHGIVTNEYLIVGTQMMHHELYEELGTDYGHATDSVIYTREFHKEGLFALDDEHSILKNIMQNESQEEAQAVHQNFASKCQAVFLESMDIRIQREHTHDPYLTESVTKLGSNFLEALSSSTADSPPLPSVQYESCFRKRARESTCFGHNGVAVRYDGVEERFTAYYRPSYRTKDDCAVFLGEYPTFDEAQDAYNLLALVHEGQNAQIGFTTSAVDRYAAELQIWEGKYHVDLVCALRLRGRGLLKDNSVNYKHIGRRWSRRIQGLRYFSTVIDDKVSADSAKVGKPRPSMTTFGTPEEAAQAADQILVNRKGKMAWTNFPLSSYISNIDDLPFQWLPLTTNFRDNLTFKRVKNRT